MLNDIEHHFLLQGTAATLQTLRLLLPQPRLLPLLAQELPNLMIFVIHNWISVLIIYIPIPDTKKYSIVLCYPSPRNSRLIPRFALVNIDCELHLTIDPVAPLLLLVEVVSCDLTFTQLALICSVLC